MIPGAPGATLTARLPDGMRLSLPWPRMASSEAWHIPWNGFRYRSNAVFGRFDAARLPVPGGVLEVAFIGEPSGDRARFEQWLTTAAGDVATVTSAAAGGSGPASTALSAKSRSGRAFW